MPITSNHDAALLCCTALVVQARVLESVLAARLGWDFRLKQMRLGSDVEDDDDDGPVVVELSEQQLAQLDLTS